jgi:hypothetical protein
MLALVAQLAVWGAPIAEGHLGQGLHAHVEGPRTVPHPGQHDSDSCPACSLLSLLGRNIERSTLPDLITEVAASAPTSIAHASGVTRTVSNSSRAPPISL